ncbi:MAG: histidinol dehydrogenase [Alphaproteobacteria bacterium]|nr:histidinol dehydrogenase [Alphaproteobacteria bacterium]
MVKIIKYNDSNFSGVLEKIIKSKRVGSEEVKLSVSTILEDIKKNKDKALFKYAKKFDNISNPEKELKVKNIEIKNAKLSCSKESLKALKIAAKRIEKFHKNQIPKNINYSDKDDVKIKTRWIPLESAGIYVPGGKASYPSSVLMSAIPAKVAGVKNITMTVPSPTGKINPLILAAAELCNIKDVFRVGGAQAIGSLAYGTKTIGPVDIIVGPGNQWVAEAKKQVLGDVNIDMMAGPSEILIVADKNNNPDWIAYDMLAQAEHDESAQSILITDSEIFAKQVNISIEKEVKRLSRSEIIKKSLKKNGVIIIIKDLKNSPDIINKIGPEHLSLMFKNCQNIEKNIYNAGVIFIGKWTPEAMGDYIIGPSHVLPTNGAAKNSSGLSVYNFIKRISTIKTTQNTIKALGPSAKIIADCEGLNAHAESIQARLNEK